ncbi:MAG: YxeA family protein [Lactobacillaceae bacterium]
MKKILKIMAITLGTILILFFIAPYITKNKTGMVAYTVDMINPFISTTEVYGKVPNKPSSTWKDAGNGGEDYGYVLKSYSESGDERLIQVNTFGSKISSEVKFLKIKIKGQSVRGYEYINKDEIPKEITNTLEEE